MKQNIKELYNELDNKKGFVLLCSDEFKIKPQSISNNWFNSYWSIPDKHVERVLELLQNYLKQQLLKTCTL